MTVFKKYKEHAERLKDALDIYPEYFKNESRAGLQGVVHDIATEFEVNVRTVQRMRVLYKYLKENKVRMTTLNIIEAIDDLNEAGDWTGRK